MNLLPPEVINQRKMKRYMRIMAALWVVFSLSFLLVAAALDVLIRQNRDKCAALTLRNRDDRYTQSDTLAKKLLAKEEWLRDMRELMMELDLSENKAMRELGQAIAIMPDGMRIRTVRADKEDESLGVEGVSMERSTVSVYMEALIGSFYDVSLLSLDVDNHGGFAFVIEIKWEGAPDG